LILFIASNSAKATLYVETFSNNNACWLSVKNNGATSAAIYNGTGGNTGGYISCSLTSSTPLVFGLEPTAVWGGSGPAETAWLDITGNTLTADFKIAGTVTSPAQAMVRFYVGTSDCTYFITKDAYSWNPNNDTSWTTHQVAALEENFVREAGSDTFAYAISHLVDIGLQFGPSKGESYTGVGNLGFAGSSTTLMLDNFGTVPEPGTIPEPTTIALLGFGALALLRKRKA
jgi:hypothetical protein